MAIVIIILVATFCVACAVLLYAAVVAGKAADDPSENEPHGDHPFIPRACGCSLNLPICDSRACPALFPTERF